MNATTAHQANCLRCGRVLRSAKSIAAGRGRTCQAKVRAAAKVVDLTEYKPAQVDAARELIEDGAIILLRPRIYIAVSSDGTETYRTARQGCTCPAGIKGRGCYHRAAVAILNAA